MVLRKAAKNLGTFIEHFGCIIKSPSQDQMFGIVCIGYGIRQVVFA